VVACSGRKATKDDKRHLRPLYLRLAHVKRQMHVLETRGAGGYMQGLTLVHFSAQPEPVLLLDPLDYPAIIAYVELKSGRV
jgi:hypothetical protein